jgi:hypothetical protein
MKRLLRRDDPKHLPELPAWSRVSDGAASVATIRFGALSRSLITSIAGSAGGVALSDGDLPSCVRRRSDTRLVDVPAPNIPASSTVPAMPRGYPAGSCAVALPAVLAYPIPQIFDFKCEQIVAAATAFPSPVR